MRTMVFSEDEKKFHHFNSSRSDLKTISKKTTTAWGFRNWTQPGLLLEQRCVCDSLGVCWQALASLPRLQWCIVSAQQALCSPWERQGDSATVIICLAVAVLSASRMETMMCTLWLSRKIALWEKFPFDLQRSDWALDPRWQKICPLTFEMYQSNSAFMFALRHFSGVSQATYLISTHLSMFTFTDI